MVAMTKQIFVGEIMRLTLVVLCVLGFSSSVAAQSARSEMDRIQREAVKAVPHYTDDAVLDTANLDHARNASHALAVAAHFKVPLASPGKGISCAAGRCKVLGNTFSIRVGQPVISGDTATVTVEYIRNNKSRRTGDENLYPQITYAIKLEKSGGTWKVISWAFEER